MLVSGRIEIHDPKWLKMLRQDIYDQIDELVDILEEPSLKQTYPSLDGDMLSRMPVGYPADSPYGYILKHKDFSVYSSKPESFFLEKDWVSQPVDDFRKLYSLNHFLNYTVNEYLGHV